MKNTIKNLSFIIFTGISVAISIIIIIMFSLTYNSELSKIKASEINNLKGHHRVLNRIINSITADTLFLSKIPDIRSLIETKHINPTILEFSKSKKIYDQVRYLDSNGNELIRVNWNKGNPKLVNLDKLQNKKGRYYFDDTYNLLKNQIFISPLDLNIERGELETPLKPMLRIGTPVYDYSNNKKGIILLNYFGSDLIKELKNNINNSYSHFQLLNQEGYWLSSDIKEDEWGFMFPNKNERTFQNRFSKKVWNIIHSENLGQIDDDIGVFTFNTVYPLNISHSSSSGAQLANAPSKKNINWKNYKWKLVSYLSNTQIDTLTQHIKKAYFFPWIFFMLFSGLISYLLAKNVINRQESEQARLDAEKKYRVLFEEAGESIVITKNTDVIMINNKTKKLFEYPKEELLNTPIEALIHVEDRDLINKNHKKQFSKNIRSMVFEARILSKFGKIKWAEIRTTKLDLNSNGVTLYFFLDISERKKIELKLKELATTDFLTGCYNRRHFTEILKNEIERSKRMNYELSLVMIDLDLFKKINDTYGHDTGDLVIKKFVDISSIELRQIDSIGRLGGEEFGIILPNCSEKNGINCAERLRESIQNCFITPKNKIEKVYFTASFGVATVIEDDTLHTILKKIDQALYQAKNSGRNKTVLYSNKDSG